MTRTGGEDGWRGARLNAHPLDPRGDGTVSRIVGRRETQAIRAAELAVDEAISDMTKRFTIKLTGRSKLSRDDLAEFVRFADRRIAQSGLVLNIERDSRLARVSSPGATITFSSLSARSIRETPQGRYEGAATVNLDVLELKRGELSLLHLPLGIEWRQHVADRFHLRSETRGDAHCALGSALGRRTDILDLLCILSAQEDPRLNVPVPVADGLVVGLPGLEGGEHPVKTLESLRACGGGLERRSRELYMKGTAFHPDRQPVGWTGVTFKSAGMIGAAGRAYAEGFEALEAEVVAWRNGIDDATTPTPEQARARDALIAKGHALLDRARRGGASRREGFQLPQPRAIDGTRRTLEMANLHPAFEKGYRESAGVVAHDPKRPRIESVNGELGIVGRILLREAARLG